MSGVTVALLLGLRHGVDPDHVAAISDIATMKRSMRDTISQAFRYALGHALVVLAFVIVATAVGSSMPSWFAQVSSVLVGTTLILLGLWVLAGLFTGDATPRTRYALVAKLVGKLQWRSREVATVEHVHEHEGVGHHTGNHGGGTSGEMVITRHRHTHRHLGWLPGTPSPFAVGMAHGFGAETPTQIALLAAATTAEALTASLLGLAFVAGLVAANMGVALVAALGATGAKHSRRLSQGLTLVAGSASIYVGTQALLG